MAKKNHTVESKVREIKRAVKRKFSAEDLQSIVRYAQKIRHMPEGNANP